MRSRRIEILLQKCLIASRFNKKLILKKERTSIYRYLSQKFRLVRFTEGALDGCDGVKSVGHDSMTQIPLHLDFGHPMYIGVSSSINVSICDSPNMRLNHDRRISRTQSMVLKYAHVLIAIRWTEVNEIYMQSSVHIDPTHLGRPRHLKKT